MRIAGSCRDTLDGVVFNQFYESYKHVRTKIKYWFYMQAVESTL